MANLVKVFDKVFRDDKLVACICASVESAVSMSDSNALVQSIERITFSFVGVPCFDLTGLREDLDAIFLDCEEW